MVPSLTAEAALSAENRLEELIQRRVGNRVRNLRVLFQANGLVLQGRAAKFHAKQVAQQVVMELAPMPILANEIEVG
jgi:hypothetical protein